MCCAGLLSVIASGCSSPPAEDTGDGGLPDWYRVRFVLNYPDGRKYEGECSWPDAYDDLIRLDLETSKGLVKPGKTMTSIREVEGSRVLDFPPNGRGTMTYPNGTTKTGLWRNGEYTGPSG